MPSCKSVLPISPWTRLCSRVLPQKNSVRIYPPISGAENESTLDRVVRSRGASARLHCDTCSVFAGHFEDLLAYANKVSLEFSRPGKPTDNAFIESFNGSLREDCLNIHWFEELTDARSNLQDWQKEHNETRPHRAPNDFSPW